MGNRRRNTGHCFSFLRWSVWTGGACELCRRFLWTIFQRLISLLLCRLLCLWTSFGVGDGTNVDFIQLWWQGGTGCERLVSTYAQLDTPLYRSVFLALFKCVADGNSQATARPRKAERADACLVLAKLTQTFLVVAVPNVDNAVAAARRKRAKRRMKRERIDREHCINTTN